MVEALRDAVGPDQRNLRRRLRELADEFVLLQRNVARKPEPRLGRTAVSRRAVPACCNSGMSQRCSRRGRLRPGFS